MPRARTQLGSAICAASVSEFAVEIQAMPSTAIAGSASHSVGDSTTSTDIAACTKVPMTTNWLRSKRSRQRGNCIAATMAPPPMQASIAV